MAITANQAILYIKSNPRGFLKRHHLSINIPPNSHGVKPCYLYNGADLNTSSHQRPGRILGSYHMHTEESFSIFTAPRLNVVGASFNAYIFKMCNGFDGTANNLSIRTEDSLLVKKTLNENEPRIILTGLLTGCSIVIKHYSRTHLQCYHYKPSAVGNAAPPTGQQMETNLRSHPAFQEDCLIYGANPNNDGYSSTLNRVSIIGVYFEHTGWKIYAQIHLKNQLNPNAPTNIMAVKKIYPPEN